MIESWLVIFGILHSWDIALLSMKDLMYPQEPLIYSSHPLCIIPSRILSLCYLHAWQQRWVYTVTAVTNNFCKINNYNNTNIYLESVILTVTRKVSERNLHLFYELSYKRIIYLTLLLSTPPLHSPPHSAPSSPPSPHVSQHHVTRCIVSCAVFIIINISCAHA